MTGDPVSACRCLLDSPVNPGIKSEDRTTLRNYEKRRNGGAISTVELPRPIDKSPTPSYLSTACRSARRGIRDRGLTNARTAPSFKCLDDDCRSSVYRLGVRTRGRERNSGMFGAVARKIFGTSNDRRIRVYRPRVDAINGLEKELERLSDDELRARTEAFRKELADGKDLDDILVPAFATVREAAKRTLGQRHFDVQLIGGMVLHEGRISEMKTGEGKTLVATLPVYLNALARRGVHVVTVNDYLARRDADWMGEIYKFLGLTVGVIVHGLDDKERKAAYDCDVTYGTNNELGFDYLRDNMKYRLEDMVQRGHVYAIVDEVDSILIDESRTPLIISGPLDDRSEFYNTIDAF